LNTAPDSLHPDSSEQLTVVPVKKIEYLIQKPEGSALLPATADGRVPADIRSFDLRSVLHRDND